ncbi:Tetratricopeptide repeat protein 39A [Papilio machaon]|uniref:Tetratricopeptide repeat protein 39A n=1 Tax=Papilio machaon TaxID=76193 RepID=A0A194QWJ7_PAPMA|nr:Tetratricopeptide repeat protein 39A [Papilio machaon]
MFDEQEAYFHYLAKLQQILNTFNAIIGTLSRRMFEIVDLFHAGPKNAWTYLAKHRLQPLRNRCALATAVYRHADIDSEEMKSLRKFCPKELKWINGTATLFIRRLSLWPAEEKQRRLGVFRCYEVYGAKLLLPLVELLALGNAVAALAPDNRITKYLLEEVEKVDINEECNKSRPTDEDYKEYRAYLDYISGCCLSALDSPRAAIRSLSKVTRSFLNIPQDHNYYLTPYALLESAVCFQKLGRERRANRLMRNAKRHFYRKSPEMRTLYNMYSNVLDKARVKPDVKPKEEPFIDISSISL